MKLEMKQLAEFANQAKIKLSEDEYMYFYKEINHTLQLFENIEEWVVDNDENNEY